MRSINDLTDCVADKVEIAGHLGYRLLPGMRLRELHPDTCPAGHVKPKVTVGWGQDCRTITCWECLRAGSANTATAYYCVCRGDRIVHGGETYVPIELGPPVCHLDSPHNSGVNS